MTRTARLLFLAVLCLAALSGEALARTVPGTTHVSPDPSCWTAAAAAHNVDPLILYSIGYVESRHRSNAINMNKNGSYDLGLMQINSIWHKKLAKFGVKPEHLLDPCVSIHIGAWVLAQNIRRHGRTWMAVGAYNSATPHKAQAYAAKVHAAYSKFAALSAGQAALARSSRN